ncbi:MAG: radical SAM protein [Halobacteriaceae archaeon]
MSQSSSPSIVLTADRSLMSNFRGNYILGFLSCAPTDFVPSVVYDRLFAPPVDVHPDGRAVAAPMGLRRIQSGLLEDDRYAEEDIAIAHPNHIDKLVGNETEIIGVNAMDPLGKGPVTSSFTHDSDRTPMNAVKFRSLMESIDDLETDARVVVGGGGAWQVAEESQRDAFGIDHVIQGEAGHRAPEIFTQLTCGDAEPRMMVDSPDDMDDVPEIRAPTINALIEGMRGCGRGCDFCGPDMRRNLYADPERLTREARVNAEAGFDHVWLHGEDILLYEFDKRFEPNTAAVKSLYERLLAVPGIEKVGTTHVSLAAVAAAPDLIDDISELNDLGPNNWTGVQPGIETASPRLINKYLKGKPLPFRVEEWPDVVDQAIRILNENYIYPACTLIVGLPEETDEDVQQTIDLIERLNDTSSIFAPLMYMDYDNGNTLTATDMSWTQWKLFRTCWEHNIREFKSKAWKATQGWNPISRIVSQVLAWIGAKGIMHGLERAKPEPVPSTG